MKKDQNALPSQLCELLLAWYDRNQRVLPWRENTDPYRVWVSEIMLQQTRVEAVIPYYERFLSTLPTIEDLANADEQLLMKLWEGLGYYTRVRNLQKSARFICEQYGGVFPPTFEQIRSLPGIGDYTAGAISSIAFELPTPAVDGNVLRVLSRVTADDRNIDDAALKKEYTERLRAIYPAAKRGDFTQSLMELGAIVCLPNGEPKCSHCPLKSICQAHLQGREMELPVRTPKKSRKKQQMTVFLLKHGDNVALCKRSSVGLLSGMWEFPNTDGFLTRQQAEEWLQQHGVMAESLKSSGKAKHIFTHIEWDMKIWCAECSCLGEQFEIVTQQQLNDQIALPTAFGQLVPFLQKEKE